MTISSKKLFLRAFCLLLPQKQDFLNNQPARESITPNQQGTIKMRDEMLSRIDAPDMDTSGSQVSDLENIEFLCEDPDLTMDYVLQRGIDGPFCPSTFNTFRWVQWQKTHFTQLTTQNCSLWDTHKTLEFLRIHPFGTRIEMFIFWVTKISLNEYYRVCILIQKVKKMIHFFLIIFKLQSSMC